MFNFGRNEWSSIAYQLILIALIAMNVFVRSKSDRVLKLKQLSLWLIIIFGGVFLYNNRYKFKNMIPYIAKTSSEENAFEIEKSNDGHFYLALNMNGKNVLFMIDTGASYTTLTQKDAKRLGIDINNLKYRHPVNTANGMTFNAQSEVKDIKVNEIIVENRLTIFVSKELEGNSLLGMNFLQNLKGYKVEKDKMIIYY